MALAPLPLTPSYAISKAAALSMTQSLMALLASEGVTVHGVFLGPVDTDMTRGFEIPKASPESVAQGIFIGLENGEEDIFPDPASQSIAGGWRTGVAKEFEKQYAGFVPQTAAAL
jgi:NAD(P)-dependent dehydrogenase (short-subunit alcohol dehydrogenase family)